MNSKQDSLVGSSGGNSLPSQRIPSYTEVHMTSPIAAGLPVLEVIRRLEEEKLLSKEDKISLKEGLYSTDVMRRDEIVKALCEVELSMNSRFSVRRLKAVIHQNGGGEPSSKVQKGTVSNIRNSFTGPYFNHEITQVKSENQYLRSNSPTPTSKNVLPDSRNGNNSSTNAGVQLVSNVQAQIQSTSPILEDRTKKAAKSTTAASSSSSKHAELSPDKVNYINISNSSIDQNLEDNISTQNAISQVVGDCPKYSSPDSFNVLAKISQRLKDFYGSYDTSKMGKRKFAVLVGSGSFNPLTRMHLRTFFLAKEYLESRCGYIVLGSLLSPGHSATVRERYRTNPSEIIPPPHRLAVAQLLVQNSKLLSVDPWEITRRRAMDYLSLLEHVQTILREQFNGIEIKVLLVCKPNMVPKLSPQALRSQSFGVISVCRAQESDILRATLGSKWNGVINVVDDTAILDASLDIVTSRKVRDKIKTGETVEQLVGEMINDYVAAHRLGPKVREGYICYSSSVLTTLY